MDKQSIQQVNSQKPVLITRFFIVKMRRTGQDLSRVAFAFPRKIGQAVERNLFKRRIRELVRKAAESMAGRDYLIIARGSLHRLDRDLWQIERKKLKDCFESF